MFDKSYTLQLVTQVIKEDIIPSLNSSVAKEQAIAMISVLKNVDLNSEQHVETYLEVNNLLEKELDRILDSLKKSGIYELSGHIPFYQIQLQEVSPIEDVKGKWEALNSLLSRLIKQLYQQPEDTQSYIEECRRILRKQLEIEMRLVG